MGGAGYWHRAAGVGSGGGTVKKKLQRELTEAYPARFPAAGRDLFAERQREKLLLQCAAALAEEDGAHAAQIADIDRVLVAMMVPPPLRTGAPGNAVLELERTFEDQVAELESYCGVRDAAELSVFSFLHRIGHMEALAKRGNKS